MSGQKSKGDPRVLVVLNLVLSFIFAYFIIWGLSFMGALEFSWTTVGGATLALAVITYIIVF